MTRRQSNNQWSGGIGAHLAPKKFGLQKSSGKFLASIVCGQDDILLIDYFPKGQTINTDYSYLQVQLKDILKEKRHGKFNKVFLFLNDDDLIHRALAGQKKLAYLGFQYLNHPSYSPDLAPSEYQLFPGLKNTTEW